MKYLAPLRQVRRLVIAGALACAAATAVGVWRASAIRRDDKAESKRQFHARVRDGVGRSVKLPRPGDPPGQIRAAVNSVSSFIDRRSGVRLSAATLDRIAAMEEAVQRGTARHLTANEFGNVVAATLLERLSGLSDQEITYIDGVLRGFNAPDIPKNFSRDFRLPGGVVSIGVPPEKNVARLKAIRDQLGSPAGEVFASMVRAQVRERAQSHARYLSEAVPEQFGGMWDVANDKESSAADGGVTPLQAVLVAYSLVSDDYLSDSDDRLAKKMDAMQKHITRALGQPYPTATGQRPFGVNGYIFSSPLDVLFDEKTVNRLLDGLGDRRAP